LDIQELHSLYLSSSGVSIDTRKINNNEIFFAIKGVNFNGNDYALEAIKKGAKFSIVDDPKLKDANKQFIYVKDSLRSLQDLSKIHRSSFDTKVIGITGSNGKTTTKNLVYSILSENYKVIKTKGNLNNHIGVPLSLLEIKEDTELAVIEMGANHIGEIKELCEIAMPDIGFITNYGLAHLEGFGGYEGVIKGKSEIFRYLTENYGQIILNNDDQIQVNNCKGDLSITYGENKDSDYVFEYIKTDNLLKLKYDGFEFKSNLFGEYNFQNLAVSITIGKLLEISNKDIQNGLDKFTNDSLRSEVINFNDNKIIMDAYNANPTSMLASISSFESKMEKNKILIIGDMYELGKFSKNEHQKIVDYLENKDYHKVFLVGKHFSECSTKANYFSKYLNTDELSSSVAIKDFKNMNILVKGSRSVSLESLFN
jgi:UDP-N-acetylmuramoyl-tripeptide--D-alanyl-D-alanine ligase